MVGFSDLVEKRRRETKLNNYKKKIEKNHIAGMFVVFCPVCNNMHKSTIVIRRQLVRYFTNDMVFVGILRRYIFTDLLFR